MSLLLRCFAVVLLGAVLLAGCGREEKDKPTGATEAVTPPAKTDESQGDGQSAPDVELEPADDRDAAQFALLFPTSEKVAGWIKTEPVSGGSGEDIAEFLPELADVLRPFAPELVATTTYQRLHEGVLETVSVCLIRAASTEDAYGMLTVSSPGEDIVKVGDVSRQIGDTQIFVVRGQYFGMFKGSTAQPDSSNLVKGLEVLAGKTMFDLPGRGGPPILVQMFQTERMPPVQTFFLRSIMSMTGPAGGRLLKELGLADVEKMTDLLKLGRDVEFALGAFEVPDWPTRDVIWIAKYPTAQQALQVYQEYREFLKTASNDSTLHGNTMIKAPQGRYLLGCWTMDVDCLESLNLIPRIRECLP